MLKRRVSTKEVKRKKELSERRFHKRYETIAFTEESETPKMVVMKAQEQILKAKRKGISIPIKEVSPLKVPVSKLRLHLKKRHYSLARPQFLPSKTFYPAKPLTIILKPPKSESIRVPTLPPMMLKRTTTPIPKLKLKIPENISVRPLLHPVNIKELRLPSLSLKPRSLRLRLFTLPTKALKHKALLCIPFSTYRTLISKEKKEAISISPVKSTTIASIDLGGKVPDSVVELFLTTNDERGIGNAFKYVGEPIYIVLVKSPTKEYECCETIQYLCIRVLREVGLPTEAEIRSAGYSMDEIERYLGEKAITIIDEKALIPIIKGDFKEFTKKSLEVTFENIDENALADRIKDIGKGLRFIIFHVNENIAKLFYKKLLKVKSKFHDKIFLVKPVDLSLKYRKKLAQLMWGLISIHASGSYDDILGEGKTIYYNKLEEIRSTVSKGYMIMYPKISSHISGEESREHYLLKHFVAKVLVDNPPHDLELAKIRKEERYEYIEFEKVWNEGIISDAYIKNDDVVIEVETLFGEGKRGGDPIAKIRDITVEKYIKSNIELRELWIIMENITMLMHLGDLWSLYNIYKRLYSKKRIRFKVKFFTLDLKNLRFVSIEELIDQIKEFPNI